MKKVLALMLAGSMALSLAACGSSSSTSTTAAGAAETTKAAASSAAGGTTQAAATTAAATTSTGEKILKTTQEFTYPSLDVNVDYDGWHTQQFGISETLFKVNQDFTISPWLADKSEISDKTATITLKDGICFSDGDPVTADMVKKNLERLSTKNKRYSALADWKIEVKDDKTLVITTTEINPTLLNTLTNPETGIMDLDHTTDFDKSPICTGPFVVKEFVPDGDLSVVKNTKYWDGTPKIDGVTFFAMNDEESRLLAMQNGEIDGYVSVAPASMEIYQQDPATYTVTSIPNERRAILLLNGAKIPDAVREAITLAVDKESLAGYMNGLTSASAGFFNPNVSYGKVQQASFDIEKAKKVMADAGYTLNNGVYEKDGTPLSYKISCYARRNIDTVAVLLKEQLDAFGIPCEIALEDEPDGTYISRGDFDMGFYNMITDKGGDPLSFINTAFKKGAYLDLEGFGNDATDAKIAQLSTETDSAKRDELVGSILQDVYDSHMYVSLLQYNKNSVTRAGVSGIGENDPFDYYHINKDTTMP